MTNTMDDLIGDVPVSEQLASALERMAPKDHAHSEYVTRSEVEDLKKQIEVLMNLVGDTSVADQIAIALNNNK